MYRIVVITDPYNGSRNAGFKYSANREKMYKVLDRFEDLGLARREFFNLLRSKAEMYPQYWDCESLEEAAKVADDALWVRDYGDCVSFTYDVFWYFLEDESSPFSIVVKECSQGDIENKLQKLLDDGASIRDEDDTEKLDAFEAARHLECDCRIKINDEDFDTREFIETFLQYD